MNLKVKKGGEFLTHTHLTNLTDELIVNLASKGSFLAYRQVYNHLLIDLDDGVIDLVFTGETPIVVLESYEKDQLIFKLITRKI